VMYYVYMVYGVTHVGQSLVVAQGKGKRKFF
jgi:hypothetical protein